MKPDWDVIVIGAGAAGLFAAAQAAQRGRTTLLLEKNKKLGVKILMSGGTRCNLTHDCHWREIADAFGREGKFLKSALAQFTPQRVVEFFNQIGVPTKVESTGKIFPQSDRALQVRDALVAHALAQGTRMVPGTAVTEITPSRDGFVVETSDTPYTGRSLILTCGGQSYPGCGTTGDGYAWLENLGHTVVTPRPALTPLRVNSKWVRDLQGVTINDVDLSIARPSGSGARSAERTRYRGSFLFTHFGCSGPVVLNISRCITDPQDNSTKELVCDWLPDWGATALAELFRGDEPRRGGALLRNWLSERLPRRLANTLCENAGVDSAQRMAELSRRQIDSVVRHLKQSRLPIDGTKGFAKAEVTAGGADLSEIDGKTMQSKIVPGLFVAGEILNVDGPIGGFNFQAAFSTGWIAGHSV